MPSPGPSLCGVLMAADSNMCTNFSRVFDHVKLPKNARIVEKKKEKKESAFLAWALIIKINIAASSNYRGQAREEREGRRRAGRAKRQKQSVHRKNI